MKLIKDGAIVDPGWSFPGHPDARGGDHKQVFPFEIYLAEREHISELGIPLGIQIDVDTDLDDVAPFIDQLALIVINFATYADGRGFSIAHRMRHSLGYAGIIWGRGSLIADQYALAIQCGIDAVLVEDQLLDRQPIEHWQEALRNAPAPYRYHPDMAQGH